MKKMKKLLAIMLSVLMLMSMASFGASADASAPIVIDEASDWDAYKQADGSYLLPKNGNFTVSASIETLETNFNGNGSTLTTSVPIIKNASNVIIENLTINGEVSYGDLGAAFICTLKGYNTINNVVNNANVIVVDANNSGAGGMISHFTAGLTEMSNCVNNGNVTSNNGLTTFPGGIFGTVWKATLVIENCVNNGNIVSNPSSGATAAAKACGAGGVIGYIAKGSMVTMTGCGNNGDVTAQWIAGGVIGRNYGRPNIINYCYNTGDVATNWGKADELTGGVDATGAHASMNYCWNSGDVTGNGCVAQLSGHVAVGECIGNYYLDTIAAKAFHITGAAATNEGATATTAADLASGKLAYDINTAVGASVYFQNISGNALNPTNNPADGTIVKIGDKLLSLSMVTRESAAARIEEGNAGLRFTTDIKKADYNALIAAGVSADTIKFGTFIIDFSKIEEIEDNDEVFTIDKLGADDYHNIPATLKNDSTGCYFRNSVEKIPEASYDKLFAAIGYITIGDTVIMSGTVSLRSVNEVAAQAFADRQGATADGYANAISADSAVAVDSKATYSPYTEAQLTILKAYIAE